MESIKNEYFSHERKPIIDEGLRDLLPVLSDEAHEALTLDILQNGCYSPIICMEDMTLVDGHNRYAICEENDIPYRMVVLPFEDKLAAKQWALDTQKARRNLTTWELGQIALKLKPEIEARAKETMGTRTDLLATLPKGSGTTEIGINTRKELAAAAGIGERTMGKIMKIEEEAPAPIKEAVEKSDISINKGYQLTQKLRDLPEDEREAAALEMLEKAEAEYHKGCDETDRQCDIANLFTAAFDKIAQLDPTKENIWYWIDWCGIRPSDLDSLIWEAGVAVQKFNHIVETLTEAKELGDWRNPCTILN